MQQFVADLSDEIGKRNSSGEQSNTFRKEKVKITWYTDTKTLIFKVKWVLSGMNRSLN